MAVEQIDHPGEGVGGGVFARQEHGQHVTGDVRIGEPAAGVVARRDHRLDQVGRPLAQLGLRLHPRTRLGDEIADRALQCRQVIVELAIPEPTPERKRGEQALEERREHFVEVGLDHLLVGLERVDIRAEGEPRGDIHRVAHQVGLQVDALARRRGALPAPLEAPRDLHQRRKVGLDVLRIEARHHHRPLPPPRLAVGGEQPVEPHVVRDRPQALGALKSVRPVAQHRSDGVRIGEHQKLAPADAEAELLAVLAAPLLGDEVQPRGLELQRIAEDRQPARAREVRNASGLHAGNPTMDFP